MINIFDKICDIEAQAEMCNNNERQYVTMRTKGLDQAFIHAHTQVMDRNSQEFDKTIGSLSLDNPAQMLLFIKAVKARGAVEALERIRNAGEFSNWVNLGLEAWVNRIKAEVTDGD